MKKSKEFMIAIHSYIQYWDGIEGKSPKEKMEGLAFSILCMLDGVSGLFDGNLSALSEEERNFMLHDIFYKKPEKEKKE